MGYLNFGNVEFRNIQHQVLKNKEDIEDFKNRESVLADFGIKVIGQVDSAEDLPETADNYGDAYAVGVEAPYEFYIWTRADVDSGHPEDYFLNIGQLAIVGPRGPEGEKGEKGDTGEKGAKGDTGATGAQGLQGPAGPKGQDGEKGETGAQGPRGESGAFLIKGEVASIELLPDPETGSRADCYIVGTTDPKDLYIKLGEIGSLEWFDYGQIPLLLTAGTNIDITAATISTTDHPTFEAIDMGEITNAIKAVKSSTTTMLQLPGIDIYDKTAGAVNYSMYINKNMYPYSDDSCDLGKTENRWKDLYLSDKIYLGDFRFESTKDSASGRVYMGGQRIFNIYSSDIYVDKPLYPANADAIDLGRSTNKWKDLYLSNAINMGSSNAKISVNTYGTMVINSGTNGELQVGGNISPTTTGYNLGSSVNGWNNLYLRGSIYTADGRAVSSRDIKPVSVQTTAPTAANTDGGVHIVYLTSEPATKYNGYIYLIKE